MNAQPTVYIHIGTHKTGSTAIQNALRLQQHSLKRQGVFAICPHLGFEALMRSEQVQPRFAKDFENSVHAQMGRSSKDQSVRYVMSWEGYSGNPATGYNNAAVIANLLKSALQRADVRIIVYLRRQDDFLESLYTQMIHEGESHSFIEFAGSLPETAFDWNHLTEAYGNAFGKENLIVRRYGREFLPKPESLLEDFFQIIGADGSTLSLENSNPPNRGYSRDALEIARLCNPLLSDHDRKRLRCILQDTSAKSPYEKYTFMSHAERLENYKHYAEANQQIATAYQGLSEPLFPLPETGDIDQSYKGLNIETMLPPLIKELIVEKSTVKRRCQEAIRTKTACWIRLLQRKFPGPMFALRTLLHKNGLI